MLHVRERKDHYVEGQTGWQKLWKLEKVVCNELQTVWRADARGNQLLL